MSTITQVLTNAPRVSQVALMATVTMTSLPRSEGGAVFDSSALGLRPNRSGGWGLVPSSSSDRTSEATQ